MMLRGHVGARKVCVDARILGSTAAVWEVGVETFGQALRRLRGTMSQRTLARLAFIDSGHLSRIEADQRPPTAKLAAALDAALGTGEVLTTLAATGSPDLRVRSGRGPARREGQTSFGLDGGDRAWGHDLAAAESLRTADRQVGGGHLYATVASYLRAAIAPRMFDTVSGVDARAEIFAAAASLTEMAGWMAHDAGSDRLAEDHFHRALGLATGCRDRQMAANVLGSLSHLALNVAKPDMGYAHAAQGLELLGPVTVPCLRARLFAMQARSFAARRDEVGCSAALRKAEQALVAQPDVAPSPWLSPFDHASLLAETGRCLRMLGRWDAATRSAQEVMRLRPHDRARSRAFARLLWASNLIDQERPDEACAVAGEALDTTRHLSSALVVRQLDIIGNPPRALPGQP
jgi:transcriptional regulator with XRE-family HTH domain